MRKVKCNLGIVYVNGTAILDSDKKEFINCNDKKDLKCKLAELKELKDYNEFCEWFGDGTFAHTSIDLLYNELKVYELCKGATYNDVVKGCNRFGEMYVASIWAI